MTRRDKLLLFELQQSLAALAAYGVNMYTSQDAIHAWCARYASDVVKNVIAQRKYQLKETWKKTKKKQC